MVLKTIADAEALINEATLLLNEDADPRLNINHTIQQLMAKVGDKSEGRYELNGAGFTRH